MPWKILGAFVLKFTIFEIGSQNIYSPHYDPPSTSAHNSLALCCPCSICWGSNSSIKRSRCSLASCSPLAAETVSHARSDCIRSRRSNLETELVGILLTYGLLIVHLHQLQKEMSLFRSIQREQFQDFEQAFVITPSKNSIVT